MKTRKKTWKEKLADDKDLPKVVKISGKLGECWGKATVVIAAPREVDEAMRRGTPPAGAAGDSERRVSPELEADLRTLGYVE